MYFFFYNTTDNFKNATVSLYRPPQKPLACAVSYYTFFFFT